jgi:hypothetical protein
MHPLYRVLLAVLLPLAGFLASPAVWSNLHGADASPSEAELLLAQDEKTLREAGVSSDGPGLLDFFRRRTPSNEDLDRLRAAIRRLGDESFHVREQASRDLAAAGRASLPFLRPALEDADAEVARRARDCIEEIEQSANLHLPESAARLLAARRPAGALETLLAFVPFAGEESVEDEVGLAIVALGLHAGRADASIMAALTDSQAVRRGVAVSVAGRSTDPGQRRAAARLLQDRDARVRFRAASALLLSGEKSAVPVLVELLGDGPTGPAWSAEELLTSLAGDDSPAVSLGKADDTARRQCRHAWRAWWNANSARVDPGRLSRSAPQLGLTLVCEAHLPEGGRVFECGRDGKPRWTIKVSNPIDAQLLPGGRVLVADSNNNRVVEMNREGKVLWSHTIHSPLHCQRLPNGNTFIATYHAVTEVTPDGKVVYSHTRTHGYHAQKLRNGHILCIDSAGVLTEMDSAGKQLHRVDAGGGRGQSWGSVEALPNGRFLLALGGSGKAVEIDWQGKVYWERAVPNPNSAIRLPNGNTLVASHDDKCVYEFDRGGKEVWKRSTDGHPFRARRR